MSDEPDDGTAPAWPASPYRESRVVKKQEFDHEPAPEESSDPPAVMVAGTIALALLLLFVIPKLLSVAAAPFKGRVEEKRVLVQRAQLTALQRGLAAFEADYGRLPTPDEGLRGLVYPPERADGSTPAPYVPDPGYTVDTWRRPYGLAIPSRDGKHPYEVYTLGRDGRPGGEGINADLSSRD